jgi:bifunctional DNA primase/polymerase-like protein
MTEPSRRLSPPEAIDATLRYWRDFKVQVRRAEPGSERILESDWPIPRALNESQIRAMFDSLEWSSVCVSWGVGSQRLVDVEGETPFSTRALELWLPASPVCWGSPRNPGSHRLLRIAGHTSRIKTRKPTGPKGRVLVELRADGSMSVMPPSAYSAGAAYAFTSYDLSVPIPEVAYDSLLGACEDAVAATLIAEQYPQLEADRTRHHMALAISDILLRSGRGLDACLRFIIRLMALTGDDEAEDRIACVHSTCEARHAGLPTTGIPTLRELLGLEVVRAVTKLLHVSGDAPEEAPLPPEPPAHDTTFIGPAEADISDQGGMGRDPRGDRPS